MKEQNRRSLLKGVSWRCVATLDTILLAYFFTGNISQAVSIGGLELVTKTALFYMHERAWLRVGLGRFVHEGGAREWHSRSLIKAISWRFFGTLDTFLLALLVTGELAVSASIGIAELVTKIALYYAHERVWFRVSWGMRRP